MLHDACRPPIFSLTAVTVSVIVKSTLTVSCQHAIVRSLFFAWRWHQIRLMADICTVQSKSIIAKSRHVHILRERVSNSSLRNYVRFFSVYSMQLLLSPQVHFIPAEMNSGSFSYYFVRRPRDVLCQKCKSINFLVYRGIDLYGILFQTYVRVVS